MKEAVKTLLKHLLLFLRDVLDPFFRFQEISVLCYHSIGENNASETVSAEAFSRQMAYLSRKKTAISLEDIVSFVRGREEVPKKSVVVTFDDGYHDFVTNALPVLKKYNIPTTLFITGDPKRAYNNLDTGVPLLSSEDVKLLQKNGIDIQYHSKTHKLLDNVPAEVLKNEVENPANYHFFAYPGGHHSSAVHQAIGGAGYDAAFSIRPGLVNKEDSLFTIRRNVITANMPFWLFRFHIVKAVEWYYTIVNRIK